MRADIAKKWVEALRSGKYKQTRHRLHRNGGFCCLGVLCDLVKDEVKGKWVEEPFDVANTHAFVVPNCGSLSKLSTLPAAVCKFTGLRDNWGTFIREAGNKAALSHMNDNGATFEEIADTIEKYAEVL